MSRPQRDRMYQCLHGSDGGVNGQSQDAQEDTSGPHVQGSQRSASPNTDQAGRDNGQGVVGESVSTGITRANGASDDSWTLVNADDLMEHDDGDDNSVGVEEKFNDSGTGVHEFETSDVEPPPTSENRHGNTSTDGSDQHSLPKNPRECGTEVEAEVAGGVGGEANTALPGREGGSPKRRRSSEDEGGNHQHAAQLAGEGAKRPRL